MSPTTPAEPEALSLAKKFGAWAGQAILGGLCAAAIAGARWGVTTDTNVHDLEQQHADIMPRLAKLEARDDSYQQLRLDIAVIKEQLDQQKAQNARIEALLLRLEP